MGIFFKSKFYFVSKNQKFNSFFTVVRGEETLWKVEVFRKSETAKEKEKEKISNETRQDPSIAYLKIIGLLWNFLFFLA